MKEIPATGFAVASQPRPFCTSATTFVTSASENFSAAVGPCTMTMPTATEPSR